MSRRRWIGVVVAALAVPVAAGFVFVVLVDNVMSGFGACRVVRQSAFASPSGSKLVVVVWKSCGATVPDGTQASIVARGRTFSPESTPTFLSLREHSDVAVSWSGEQSVRIGLIPASVQIYKRDRRAGDVTINYE